MNLLKYIFGSFFLCAMSIEGTSQILSVYGHYVEDSVRICRVMNNATDYLDLDKFRYKNLYHFKVSGNAEEISEQLKGIKAFSETHDDLRIRILEIENSPEIETLDESLEQFEDLSTLIINNCDQLKIENIVRFIQNIHQREVPTEIKSFKKVFKARPDVFYLNSLILKNQLLEDMGPPPPGLKIFNYLEELRIEDADDLGDAQGFVNSLVNDWLVPNTEHFLYSTFPNVKFLGFKNCNLDSIPSKLKFRSGMVSLDFSGNNLKEIPDCVTGLRNLDQVLSLDLSHNQISEIDSLFLEKFSQNLMEKDTISEKKKTRSSKFSKYLFLSHNKLSYDALYNAFKHKKFSKKFNTLTFKCNPIKKIISKYDEYSGAATSVKLPRLESILELANGLDQYKIARFMTGAQRSETDYNPADWLFEECPNIE